LDSNSSRGNIYQLNSRFKGQKVAIIGLGGTGSYVLDLVSKTPVGEIMIFDGDEFLQHNAFRSPGAASVDILNSGMKKVDYFASIYSQLHRGIKAVPENITEANIDRLQGFSYVFICVDRNSARGMIITKLLEFGVPFIDAGLGVNVVGDQLIGTLRVTSGTAAKNDHIPNRIGLAEHDDNDYATNIQIADLNALNALMAVIKWKKLCGFYQDLKQEYNSTYTINTSQLINEDLYE
jgi:predicted ThiF/HesA family dinucleotide-utilizing enzyme